MLTSGQPELDPPAILRSLGLVGEASIRRVSGGSDTALWRVELPSAVYALRVFRPEQVEVCRREVLAMRAAAAAGLATPAVHGEAQWNGHPALLLSWCDGQPLLAALSDRPWSAWSLGVVFGQEQARIHALPAPDGLRGWEAAWCRWLAGGEPALLERLRALAPSRGALLHLDYHPLNVMVHGRQVSGLLDWANAAAGDPRLDVARTVTILRLAPAPPGGQPHLASLLRWALELGWRRGYRQIAGRLESMALFYAAAGAIMERDLAPRVGPRGSWLTQSHLDRIHRWTLAWKERVGIRG